MTEKAAIISPCVRVCRPLEVGGPCSGCMRTREEITRWYRMTDDERQIVLNDIPLRLKAFAKARRAARLGEN